MATKIEDLKEKSTIGDTVIISPRGRPHKLRELMGKVVDEVSVFAQFQADDAYKFFIQKIRQRDNNIIFRLCCYTINEKGTKLVFGPYLNILYEKEFKRLMTKAKQKGFF